MEELDKVVELKDSVHVGPFQMEILKGRVVKSPTHNTHIMIAPLRCSKIESGRPCLLPPGLQVLHAYTMLTTGSRNNVSIVVQNMADSAIFLKKGVCVVHVRSATLVPLAEVPHEEAAVGAEALQE